MKVITRFLHGQKFKFKMPGPNKFFAAGLKMVSKKPRRVNKGERGRRDGHGTEHKVASTVAHRRVEPSIFPNHNVKAVRLYSLVAAQMPFLKEYSTRQVLNKNSVTSWSKFEQMDDRRGYYNH